jgi:hypothetical protein
MGGHRVGRFRGFCLVPGNGLEAFAKDYHQTARRFVPADGVRRCSPSPGFTFCCWGGCCCDGGKCIPDHASTVVLGFKHLKNQKKQGATGITTVAPYIAGQWGRGNNRLLERLSVSRVVPRAGKYFQIFSYTVK